MNSTNIFSWTLVVEVPVALRVTLLNYLNFFSTFARATRSLDVVADYASEAAPLGFRITITFNVARTHASDEETRAAVERALREFWERGLTGANEQPPAFQREMLLSEYERDLFLILFKRAVADIRTDIRFNFNLLTDEQRRATAHTLAVLSTTTEAASNGHLLASTLKSVSESSLESAVATMLQTMNALTLPSERLEIPASLVQKATQLATQRANAGDNQQNEEQQSAEQQKIQQQRREQVMALRDAFIDFSDELERLQIEPSRKYAMLIDDAEGVIHDLQTALKQEIIEDAIEDRLHWARLVVAQAGLWAGSKPAMAGIAERTTTLNAALEAMLEQYWKPRFPKRNRL